MAFQLQWTDEAQKQYNALKDAAIAARNNRRKQKRFKSSKQEGLFKQVAKATGLLVNDPRHPGLNCHQYSGLAHPYDPHEKVWEAYAQSGTPGAYRIFWCYGPKQKQITIISITPHP